MTRERPVWLKLENRAFDINFLRKVAMARSIRDFKAIIMTLLFTLCEMRSQSKVLRKGVMTI
jgi:hypothetical protein